MESTGSEILIKSMINQNIKYVFGIPGAKIDKVFEDLEYNNFNNSPRLIISRHEQNAALIASGIGRITGKPGVVISTSGPGVSNLVTSLITANIEGDPVIAIGGQVPRVDLNKKTHQSIPSKELMSSIVKKSVEVQDVNDISSAFTNSYNVSSSGEFGATFMSLPSDILSEKTNLPVLKTINEKENSEVDENTINKIVKMIKDSKLPVLLVGMHASYEKTALALHKLLKLRNFPVVETFQGAGVISKDLEKHYFGRVGLFPNQVADELLKESDLIITLGYNPVEYEANNWNIENNNQIIHIDNVIPELTNNYQPDILIQADIEKVLNKLTSELNNISIINNDGIKKLSELQKKFLRQNEFLFIEKKEVMHPIQIIRDLQEKIDENTTVTVDVGSHYIWMARFFKIFKPRHLLFSDGMQTLGVALPWSIAAKLVRPNEKIISVSGDGGFLFSGQELETEVRLGQNNIHIIWVDGYYDMVKFQEQVKYGKVAGVKFGSVNYIKYAESFGAKGFKVNNSTEFRVALDKGLNSKVPVIIEIPVDYSDNTKLETNLVNEKLN